MDNSEKGLFSPSKSTANSKSSFVGGNNEKDSCQDMMGPKSQNHKKVVVKRFMSPTISAASKAAPSRKKILVDRNENLNTSDDQNHAKRCNGDFDSSRSLVFTPNSRHNEPNPDGEMENKATIKGSSVNAYDPSNNYLSPRPRFLRFNPNKRREIFNRLDREGCGVLENGSSGSLERSDQEDSAEEAGKISKVSPFKENNVKSNDTEIPNGGEDDVDDDDGDDDDDVDCDDEDEYEEELEKDKGGRCFGGVIKILLTTLACLLSVSCICSMNSPSFSVSSNGMWNLSNGYAAMIKEQSFEPINIYGHGFLANQPEYSGSEYAEFEEDDDGEIEESFDQEMPEDEVSDVCGNYEEVATDAYVEVMDMVEKDVGIEDVRSSGNSELKEEKPDESMDFDRSSLEKQAENPHIVPHNEASNQTEAEDSKVMDHHETYEEVNIGSTEDLTEPGHETDGSLMQKTKWDSTSTIIGFSLVSMILAPLALFYYSKKNKIACAEEPRSRSHTVKQQHNFMSEDKATNPAEKKVEFLARSMQHNTPMKESYETIKDDINAPSVELLGEIVIGQVNNLRICSEAHKINELKEVNTDTFFTNQVSLAQSDSTPTQPSSHVHSTSTESKSLRNNKVRDAEEAMTEVTPLRRSARLRNRITIITSP